MSFSIWTTANCSPRLEKRADKAAKADRVFFARGAERRHRIRLSHTSEIDGYKRTRELEIPPGFQVFTCVRVITAGFRMRLFGLCTEGAEMDLPEEECHAIYEVLSTPRDREIEARVREEVRAYYARHS
jgi:hypothetical protein